jgi:hypothetical protein
MKNRRAMRVDMAAQRIKGEMGMLVEVIDA